MICPKCKKEGSHNTTVSGTRSLFAKKVQLSVVRRTRKCKCGEKWHTWEVNKKLIIKLIEEKLT